MADINRDRDACIVQSDTRFQQPENLVFEQGLLCLSLCIRLIGRCNAGPCEDAFLRVDDRDFIGVKTGDCERHEILNGLRLATRKIVC